MVNTHAMLAEARLSARAMHIGWVLVWTANAAVPRYLRRTRFRLAYLADGAAVYRPAALAPGPPATALLDPPRLVHRHPTREAHRGRRDETRRGRLPTTALLDPPRLAHRYLARHARRYPGHRARRPGR